MNRTLTANSQTGQVAKLGKPETQPALPARNDKQNEKAESSKKAESTSPTKNQAQSENSKDKPVEGEKRVVQDVAEISEKRELATPGVAPAQSSRAALTSVSQAAQTQVSSARAAAVPAASLPLSGIFNSAPSLESISSSKVAAPSPVVITAAERNVTLASQNTAQTSNVFVPSPGKSQALQATVPENTSRTSAAIEQVVNSSQTRDARSDVRSENAQLAGTATKPAVEVPTATSSTSRSQTAAFNTSEKVRSQVEPSMLTSASKVVDKLTVTELVTVSAKKEALVTTVVGTGINNIKNSFNETKEKKPELLEKPAQQGSSTSTGDPVSDIYEFITGISQDTPEIIMATNFSPLYLAPPATSSGNKTNTRVPTTTAGDFFDAQVYVRNQKWRNSKALQKAAKKEVSVLDKKFQVRHEEFKKTIEGLSVVARYLLELNGSYESLRSQLDIRHEIHTVDPRAVLRQYLVENGDSATEETIEYLTNSFNTSFLLKYNIAQVLNKFGANEGKVKNTYTSTKNWMQLLLELKDVLKTHSLSLLDIKPAHYQNDTSPTKIARAPKGTVRFQYSNYTMPLTLQLIGTISRNGVESSANVVEALYSILYEKVNFSNDAMRIAALLNNISREYRYSRGLLDNKTKEELARYYGFAVESAESPANRNASVVDVIIGRINDSITEAVTQPLNSLASIAQTRTQSGAILTLESRKVEGANNLIAGSNWYANCNFTPDGMFDTTRLEDLRRELFSAEKAFTAMVKGLNLLSITTPDSNLDTIVSDSRLLFDKIRKDFIDDDGNPTALVENDVLTPVFALAKNNVKIRSLLFLYLSMRQSASVSDEYLAAREKNVNMLVDEVERVAKTSETLAPATDALYQVKNSSDNSASSRNNVRDIIAGTLAQASASNTKTSTRLTTKDTIKEALNRPSSSKLLEDVQKILGQISAVFKANAIEENSSKTLYGGHVDTVIMMAVFDTIYNLISSYGNQKITGIHTDEGVEKLVVQIQKKNYITSIAEIDERLDNEIILAQHSAFMVMNTLKKLYNSISNIINYTSHESGKNILNGIATLFSNNTGLLPFIFSDQQIKLFANSVADLDAALGSNPGLTVDVDGDDDFDLEDQFRLLDDSIITNDLKKTLESVFSSQQFVAPGGSNLKIFTVGIPLGFVQKLREKDENTKLKKSTPGYNRQNDIVKVKLYKIDLINPDVIYKPREYLFELSRYPVRVSGFIKNNQQQSDGLLNVIRRFPTRDYSDVFVSGGSLVQYLDATKDEKQALVGEDYSFLSPEQKRTLYTNHVLSYLLEVYIKIMTGISTADHHFDMVVPQSLLDEGFAADVVSSSVSAVVKNTTNKIKNSVKSNSNAFFGVQPSPKAGKGVSSQKATMGRDKQIVTAADLVDTIASQRVASIIPSPEQTAKSVREIGGKNIETLAAAVNEASRMLTPMADVLSVSRRLILPNIFDRVFNIAVDPLSFTIDKDETYKTPYGESAIKAMILNGDVEINSDELVMRKRYPAEGELLFEKYFVAVETVGDEE